MISADLQKKVDILVKYDEAYEQGKPLVSDAAYDLFKDSVVKHLPPDHSYLDKVGHDPISVWPKEPHIIFMGSQNKVSSVEEIKTWVNSVYKSLGVKDGDIKFVIQFKMDGFSLESIYPEGRLEKALTRGAGVIGENIRENALMFRGLPGLIQSKNVQIKKDVVVRGEGLLSKTDFETIQDKTGEHYINPRNAAAGISRRQDGRFSKYIRYYTYDINAKVKTEEEKIAVLNKLGFVTVQSVTVNNLDEIIYNYIKVKDTDRETLEFAIDGLVLKLSDLELQDRLGISHNKPNGQVALKFESDQALTTVNKIVSQVGRTGRLTPVAILEPVDLMGSTVSKATLHNYAYIEQNGIGVGAEVTLEKKGDIIPQVVEVTVPGEDFVKPTSCPSCGGSLKDDGVNLWCFNAGCPDREIARITYWMKTLDIKGFSEKFIRKLWENGKLKSTSDMYKLTPEDFQSLSGIGEKTIKSFYEALTNTKEMRLDKFITALGIPTLSTSTAKVLVDTFGTWNKIASLTSGDISVLPGFAETSSNEIVKGLSECRGLAEELLSVITIKEKAQGALTGKSFCATGALVSMSRKGFEQAVEENGGTTKSSVVQGLTYLVTNKGTDDGLSSKHKKALQLGVQVINEEQFLAMIGKKVEPVKEPDKEEAKIEPINIFE